MRVGARAALILLGWAASASAQPASYGQYLVVLDDSGSMDQTDARRLVVMASLALTAGLEDGDQVMLVGLNELASGDASGPAFRSPRELLAQRDGPESSLPVSIPRAQRIGTHHGQTPCRAALNRAQTILESVASAGAAQTLLLLTDGACNGGSIDRPERWLQSLRSHREGRFRFVLLMRQGGGRPDRRLVELARDTGWTGDTSVAFDARALLRAFADVLSFSRGLRYDDGGRVGLERTFAGARSVRSLAISDSGARRIQLQRVENDHATALQGGPTYRSDYEWSFRVARGGSRDVPYSVRSQTDGVEVLVIPVYGRLRIEGVVAPCGTRPPLPWTAEWAVRAGQPACAYARLVGDAGETIVPGRSFDFNMEICDSEECAVSSAMQPGDDGTFNAVLGDLPLGRHERTFRARGGALAFPVVERRGFAAVSFGVHHVAPSSDPDHPIHSVDIGTLPTPTPEEISLVVTGSFPASARGAVGCALTGAAADCLECAVETPELELQDRMTVQVRIEATPLCEVASEQGELPITGSIPLTPIGGAENQLSAHLIPLRGVLRYAESAGVEFSVEGGSESSAALAVPAPAALTEVSAEVELDASGLEVVVEAPGRIRGNENGVAEITVHAEAAECCTPQTYEGRIRLSVGDNVLHVPLSIHVQDPGFWVCPFRRIMRWTIAILSILLLIWIIRGFLSPAKFGDGALILNADSHERLLALREGDDGYRKLKRFLETKRGFRRPAALYLGGKMAPLPSLKRMPEDARIEALPGGGAQLIVTGPGVERFTESKGWHELETGTTAVSSKIQLRRGETYLEFPPVMTRVAILALLSSCAPDTETLVVFAASSLTDAFEALEDEFESAHPEIDVRLVFAGSQVLRLQIEQGADADVIATANEAHLRALRDAQLVDEPRIFAHNELVVIVPRDSRIRRFADLDTAERVVLGTEAVPVGIYARHVIARAGESNDTELADALRAHVVSEEGNARLVRAKVEIGEADAAFVYRTDVNERVRAIAIPEEINVRAAYGIARLTPRGEAWIAHVISDAGQATLQRHGFTR